MTTEAELFDALKYHVEVDQYGTRYYYNSAGQLHRDEGPAVIYTNGNCEWWQSGQLHRRNGPALEHANGTRCWFLYGRIYSELEYATALAQLPPETHNQV